MFPTRRAMVKTGLAGAAVLSNPAGVLAAEKTSVIVIGAGLAGLFAALQLADAGVDVTVLEGSQRIGGRTFTDDASPLHPELGASQVGASYARVINLCRRLKVRLTPDVVGAPLTMSSRINGAWVRADQWEASPVNKMVGAERKIQPAYAGAMFAERFSRLKEVTDWLDPAFADLDVSLYELMVKTGASPEALRLADISGFGNDIQSSSILALAQESTRGALDRRMAAEHPENPPQHRIAGGVSRLAEAMAAALGDRVRRGKIVTTIDMEGPKAEVVCMDSSRYRADYVIAAIPFSLLRRVTITPRMPPRQAEAVELLPSGFTSRGFGVITGKYWEQDGLDPGIFSDELVKMVWVYNPLPGEDFHRFTVVQTGDAAMRMDLLPDEESIRLIESELVRMRPSMAGKFKLYKWYGWGRNALAQGCRHIYGPGQVTRFAKAMIEPHVRLHLAGEHTRRIDFGMEAAMESGERAASEVLERI